LNVAGLFAQRSQNIAGGSILINLPDEYGQAIR
jgi:hypothetical protein